MARSTPQRAQGENAETRRVSTHELGQLAGQTLLVIGGSSGIGLETARRAHAQGASVIITARDPARVHRAGLQYADIVTTWWNGGYARV